MTRRHGYEGVKIFKCFGILKEYSLLIVLLLFPPFFMHYVDGFLIPLPKKNIKMYRKMAQFGKKTWMKHGALDYKECLADDLRNPMGAPLASLLKFKPGETAVFAYIVFKSRKHRDLVNEKVMSDPAMNGPEMAKKMPFDMQRVCYGGFKAIVEA